jgi:5-formyltetrahydrofolate cyclo-ligase
MVSKAVADSAAEAAAPGSKEGAWKWAIRKRMWDYMEENDIARSATLVKVGQT